MQVVDLSKPGEKKKLIMAAVLGLVAILVLWWTLIGFDSGTPATDDTPDAESDSAATSNETYATRQSTGTAIRRKLTNLAAFTEVRYAPSSYNAPEARRNIFAYYEPPP